MITFNVKLSYHLHMLVFQKYFQKKQSENHVHVN